MHRGTLLLPTVTLLLGTLFPTATPPQSVKQAVPIHHGWGIALEADRPFPRAGSELRASFSLTNFSHQDAYGFVPVSSNLGCTYDFRILDANGNVVWEPGSIVNGSFVPSGCTFGSTLFDLSSGTQFERSNTLPLIYQNNSGQGVLGDDLPPGLYRLEADVYAYGPQPNFGDMGPGLPFSASVPFQVVP